MKRAGSLLRCYPKAKLSLSTLVNSPACSFNHSEISGRNRWGEHLGLLLDSGESDHHQHMGVKRATALPVTVLGNMQLTPHGQPGLLCPSSLHPPHQHCFSPFCVASSVHICVTAWFVWKTRAPCLSPAPPRPSPGAGLHEYAPGLQPPEH